MIYIPVSFATLQSFFPMRPLTGDLKNFMDGLGPGNTPCCVQVSHSLNMAGEKIPQTYDYAKARGRSPTPIQVNGVSNFGSSGKSVGDPGSGLELSKEAMELPAG